MSLLLSRPPQEILQWRESEFGFWLVRLFDQWHEMHVLRALMMVNMVFNPQKYLDAREASKVVKTAGTKSKESALERAAQIIALPGSGAYRPPT